jgi:hypothetical protein
VRARYLQKITRLGDRQTALRWSELQRKRVLANGGLLEVHRGGLPAGGRKLHVCRANGHSMHGCLPVTFAAGTVHHVHHVHQAGISIDTEMRLHPDVLLVSLQSEPRRCGSNPYRNLGFTKPNSKVSRQDLAKDSVLVKAPTNAMTI